MQSPKKLNEKQRLNVIELFKAHENRSLEQLYSKIRVRKTKNGTTLEQIVLALKILQLTNMNHIDTARLFKVSRQTILSWKRAYGEIVYTAVPSKEIAIKLAGDLAEIQTDILKDCYSNIKMGLHKINQAMALATGTRSIYAIAEGIRVTAEVIKMEHELKNGAGEKSSDYFYNIHNMMVKNQYGNKD